MAIYLDEKETLFLRDLIEEHLQFFYRLAKDNKGENKKMMKLYIEHTKDIGLLKKYVYEVIDLEPYRRLVGEVVGPARRLNTYLLKHLGPVQELRERREMFQILFKKFDLPK